jgi:CDP-diacylglycerol--serine O-phosphatidyltransferase
VGKLKKGIYIIPSLFTCGNMTCGYLSIISSINGDFTKAAWLLVVAISFDMMDGRIARLTKTTSEFGVQMDSLSDLLSFGVAPSIMMYQFVLNTMGKSGLVVAVLFVLCSAFRLAKFNTKIDNNDDMFHNSFMGLPTPASAGLLISFILGYELFAPDYSKSKINNAVHSPVLLENMSMFLNRLMPVIMVILSLLMVSNVPYISFKNFKLSKPKAFRFLVLIIIILLFVIMFPQNIIFILFSTYIFLGVFVYVTKYWRVLIKKKRCEKHEN